MNLDKEKETIALAKQNPEVFGQIFEEYYSRIFGYALKRTARVEVAQDITSETFFKALKKLWQFQWRNIPFSAWLYKIATNEINYYFRKQNARTDSLDELFHESGFETADDQDLHAELMEAEARLERHQDFLHTQKHIAKMPIKYQEVITLRFFENKKISEISDILGKREGTIKSLLSRGLKKLKISLDEAKTAPWPIYKNTSPVQLTQKIDIICKERNARFIVEEDI